MAEEIKPVDIERVEITPAGGENVDGPDGSEGGEGAADGAGEGSSEGGAPQGGPQEQIVRPKPKEPAKEGEGAGDGEGDNTPAPVAGETPRERALRQKLEGVEADNRRLRGGDLKIGETAPPAAAKKELSPEKKALLAKYKPGEIDAFREVLPVIAEDMGFVRADQLSATQYTERADQELDDFLKGHKEYLPENDKDNVLWSRFKEEFGMYKAPQNPKDYRKIFNRIHTDIFGIKPAGDKGAINAQRQKIEVASHAGASGPSRPTVSTRPKTNTAGFRMDMLQGFSDEEKAAMAGED